MVFRDLEREKQDLYTTMGSVGTKIGALKGDATSGLTERSTTAMAYTMVASLAHYDDSHKGVEETYLNSTTLEAHAVVSTAVHNRLQGNFAIHSYTSRFYITACHLCPER